MEPCTHIVKKPLVSQKSTPISHLAYVGGQDKSSEHVAVTAWLMDQAPTYSVPTLNRAGVSLENCIAFEGGKRVRLQNDARRLSCRMSVNDFQRIFGFNGCE